MEMITVNHTNIEKEHICCAIASNTDRQVQSKKEWMTSQFNEGLVFTKMDVRGKCFIEYIPIENAWSPIAGNDIMFVNCLWVAGKFQGLGYAKALLESCKQDSLQKGKKGIVIISAKKKKPYTMDYQFLVQNGFYSVDVWEDTYELMFYLLTKDCEEPKFQV